MEDCIFCRIVKGEAKSWKIYENESVYAFLDIHPANAYHTLVIPKQHYTNIFDLPLEELNNVMEVIKLLITIYREKLGIDNVQIINSSGADAQQDVFHTHFHILPRHKGDGQNITWDTKPEMMEEFDDMIEKLSDQRTT